MDRLAHVYNTMLLGISYIATTVSFSLGLVTPQRPPETYSPSNSVFVMPTAAINPPETPTAVTKKPATSFTTFIGAKTLHSTKAAILASPTSHAKTTPTHAYNIIYFDIDKAPDKTYVKGSAPDAKVSAAIQSILNTASIKPSLAQSHAVVLTSVSADSAGSGTTTIYKIDKPIPIPGIGSSENGKVNDFHKYILIRSTLPTEEMAQVYLHELGHVTGNLLNADQFTAFMQTRHMSTQLIDSWYEFYKRNQEGAPALEYANWKASPGEDFAEVFRVYYGKSNQSVKTNYGAISAETVAWFTKVVTPLAIL